ncbi:MAG: SDR family oxidoreductase [Thermodesulfobacteriota bacterium]
MRVTQLFDLADTVSIVTGGGAGLGRTMATGLAEAGSNVVVCSRKLEKCEETAHELAGLGVKALALPCDLTREEEVDRVVAETIKEFKKVDVLVNNSGRTWGGWPEEFKLEDWRKVLDVNITGTFLFSQRVGREMIKRQGGKIVNIASYAGLGGTNPECLNGIPYNTSKGAVIVFTKDLAAKWAQHHIKVNCLAPGWFPTKMTKWTLENKGEVILSRLLVKRFGQEDDLKAAVVFLSSRASDYITGQVLSVDGGLTVWY